LRQGLRATGRTILFGLCIDVLYQHKVLDEFYPAEAALIAIVFAGIPYFLWRWLIERAALHKPG